jgi:hypothetical protein
MFLSLGLAGGVMLMVICAYLFARQSGYTPRNLLADPVALYKFPIFSGMVSQFGIYMMLSTAAICSFAAQFKVAHRKRLIAVATLSFALAMDDQYLIHERIAPLRLGISEQMLILYYGLFALGIVYQFGRKLFEMAQWPLLLAGVMLFASVLVDLLRLDSDGVPSLVEDFSKLTGYALWAAFWIVFGSRELRTALVQTNTTVEQ